MKTTFFIRIGLLVACCLPATLKADDLFILTGSSVALFNSSGTLINQHFIPNVSGPAIYISGNDIFIPYSSSSAGNGGVGEYTTSGATVNASLISGLNGNLGDVAVSGNDIFVVNNSAGTIGEYTTSGATVNTALITGLNHPLAMVISGNDIFVLNQGAGTVGEYTTSGATVNASLISGLGIPFSFWPAGELAISGNDLFVANYNANVIGEYTTSGATVSASLISVNNPTALAISGNDIYVNVLNYINEYTTSGATIAHPLINPSQYGPGGISGAFAVAPVPEPATTALLWAGAAAGLARCRRKS